MTISKFILVLLAGSLLDAVELGADNLRAVAGGVAFNMPVKSRKEMGWERVVRQQYDYSCGSAAIATLLTFHYERPTREEEVFQSMFAVGDQAKIRSEGFSLFDMKLYLDRQGLNSDGFRMTLDKLAALGVPGIALVDTRGYKHFVVIKAVREDSVLVGDPAAGTVAVPREIFESIWNGAVLAARAETAVARQYFDSPADWKALPSAPLAQGLDRNGVGMFTLSLPGRNEFGR